MFWAPTKKLDYRSELWIYRRCLRIGTVAAVLFTILNCYYLITDLQKGFYNVPHAWPNFFAIVALIASSILVIIVNICTRKRHIRWLMRGTVMFNYIVILLSVAVMTYTNNARAMDAGADAEYMGIMLSAFYLMLLFSAPMPRVSDSLILLGVLTGTTVWLSTCYGHEYFHLFKQISYRVVMIVGYIYMRKMTIDYAHESYALSDANTLLQNYSYTDQLTGAWNRHALEMHHNRAMDLDAGRTFGYVMLDVDDFKAYNDQYSHNRGDEVLYEVSRALITVLGESGKLYRFGGEEFLIIIRDCDREKLMGLVLCCKEEIKRASKHQEDSMHITASFGCTLVTLDESAMLREIILQADKQLHIAKENGKDCVVFENEIYR